MLELASPCIRPMTWYRHYRMVIRASKNDLPRQQPELQTRPIARTVLTQNAGCSYGMFGAMIA